MGTTLQELLQLANTPFGGAMGMLVLFLLLFLRRIVGLVSDFNDRMAEMRKVYEDELADTRKDRNDWKAYALSNLGTADKTVAVAKQLLETSANP